MNEQSPPSPERPASARPRLARRSIQVAVLATVAALLPLVVASVDGRARLPANPAVGGVGARQPDSGSEPSAAASVRLLPRGDFASPTEGSTSGEGRMSAPEAPAPATDEQTAVGEADLPLDPLPLPGVELPSEALPPTELPPVLPPAPPLPPLPTVEVPSIPPPVPDPGLPKL